ncbi:MAG TPA: hypothetical protein VFD38_14290 [Myxococcaceae bacterium]|nr:hypothetical protein [Myxococcaceae bacterium]
METKRSIKAVAVAFLGVSLVGLLLSAGATGGAVGAEAAAIVDGP